jgi:hypothetical protein
MVNWFGWSNKRTGQYQKLFLIKVVLILNVQLSILNFMSFLYTHAWKNQEKNPYQFEYKHGFFLKKSTWTVSNKTAQCKQPEFHKRTRNFAIIYNDWIISVITHTDWKKLASIYYSKISSSFMKLWLFALCGFIRYCSCTLFQEKSMFVLKLIRVFLLIFSSMCV